MPGNPGHAGDGDVAKELREARDPEGRPRYSTRDWAAWVLTGDPR